MKTSINFKEAKFDSEIHNFRKKHFNYVRKDLSSKNEYWKSESIAERRIKIESYCKEKSGRKLQKNAMPIREAVVVIKNNTTMLDLQNLSKRLEEELGIKVFQIAIHKDEGHYDKDTEEWKPNYHAHLVADWQDLKSGKTLKHQSFHYSKMQDITAESLGMERGVSNSVSRLEALEYKIKMKEEEYAQILEKTENLKCAISGKKISELIATKTDLLGFKKIQTNETVSNFNNAFATFKIDNEKKKSEVLKKSMVILDKEKQVKDLTMQLDIINNNQKILLTDFDKYKTERINYLYSINNLLKREIQFQLELYPNRNRERNEDIVSEINEICSRLSKKNKIPIETFRLLLSEKDNKESVINLLKNGNKKENQINNNVEKEKNRGRKL